jgi:hypothetical protein
MELPGHAWLEFTVSGDSGGNTIHQTATFDPLGLLGRACWYAVHPLHKVVFDGMPREIAAAASLRPRPGSDGCQVYDDRDSANFDGN